MKRILQNSFGKTILCLLVALMSGGTSWAGSYISQAKVAAVGEGKVYVSKTEINNPDYQENSTTTTTSSTNNTHSYYFYAQANEGHYFNGWYDNALLNGNAVSPENPYSITVTVDGWGEDNAVAVNLWAQFLPKHDVVFSNITIPYGTTHILTKGTGNSVDVKTDGTTVTASNSTNTSVATISGLTITPAAVGTTTITVASAEGPTYLAGNGTITVNVTAPEGVATAPSGEYTETYKIPASGYGTYCSQYPIDFTRSFLNGETAYTVKEKTETLVRLHLISETSIKGGVGFVVKGEPGTTVTFRFTNSSNVPAPNMLFGTTAPTYIEYEAAYGMKDGGFHLNNAGVVPAHRAFIPNGSAGSVKALTLEFEEEDPTGIEEFKFEDDSNAVIYNLSGQRINKMQRGINIVNGKKILK